MSDMYGTTFTKSHGVNPDGNNVWGAVLAGLTKEQVTKGLRVLAESGREFPPSAPVFKQMCLTKSVNEYHQQIIQEERERQSRLPKPTTKEKGIQAMLCHCLHPLLMTLDDSNNAALQDNCCRVLVLK